MTKPIYGADHCLKVTGSDLELILTALAAYAHNNDYVRVLARLQDQLAPRGGPIERRPCATCHAAH